MPIMRETKNISKETKKNEIDRKRERETAKNMN